MAFTGKNHKNTYKDILNLDNSNGGQDSILGVKDGEGVESSLKLGPSNTYVIPSANSTSTLKVTDSSTNPLLTVDGTDKIVKVNETQSIANTQYLRFSGNDIDVDAGTHWGVPLVAVPNAAVGFGTDVSPAYPSTANRFDDLIHVLHYVDTNITVDAVNILAGADSSSSGTMNFNLIALTTTDSTTIDEWGAGSPSVIFNQASATTNDGYEQFYRIVLDIVGGGEVDAGSYLALTIESSATTSDISVNALIRYHLR